MSAVNDNDGIDNEDGYDGHEVDDDVFVVGTFHHTYCL